MRYLKSCKGYRAKQTRPFSASKSLHLVLRARTAVLRKKGNLKLVSDLLFLYSKKYHVKVYQNSVNSSHLHLIIFTKEKKRKTYKIFYGSLQDKLRNKLQAVLKEKN